MPLSFVSRGGTVYDGGGGPRYPSDVAIDGDRVAGVGVVPLDVRQPLAHRAGQQEAQAAQGQHRPINPPAQAILPAGATRMCQRPGVTTRRGPERTLHAARPHVHSRRDQPTGDLHQQSRRTQGNRLRSIQARQPRG